MVKIRVMTGLSNESVATTNKHQSINIIMEVYALQYGLYELRLEGSKNQIKSKV